MEHNKTDLLPIVEAAELAGTALSYFSRLMNEGKIAFETVPVPVVKSKGRGKNKVTEEHTAYRRKAVRSSVYAWIAERDKREAEKLARLYEGSLTPVAGWRLCKGECTRYYPETERYWHLNRTPRSRKKFHTVCAYCRNHPTKSHFKSRKRNARQLEEAHKAESPNSPSLIFVRSEDVETERGANLLGESYLRRFRTIYTRAYNLSMSPEYEAVIVPSEKTRYSYAAFVWLPLKEFKTAVKGFKQLRLWFVVPEQIMTLSEALAYSVASASKSEKEKGENPDASTP